MINIYTKDKPQEYYQKDRQEIAEYISVGDNCVLDVGCGEASFGNLLKVSGKAKYVVGIEKNREIASKAKKKIDEIVIGNIEEIIIPEPYGKYDYIVANDVLEHLVDPWNAIKSLRNSLKDNGVMVFSVPNIRNWTVLLPLLVYGKWEYKEHGILDSTHLRFFTKDSCREIVKKLNLKLLSIDPAGSRIARKFNYLKLNMLEELTALQYVVVCKKVI